MCVADFSDSYFCTRHLLQYCLMNNLIESRLELQIRKNRQRRTIILLQKMRHYL